MVLQEVDACPLSETPSFTSSMILQSREKLQKWANEFINPEQLEYNSGEYFAKMIMSPSVASGAL